MTGDDHANLLPPLPDAWVGGVTRRIVGEGSGRAVAMIVGEAPGANEWDKKRPFIGDAGDFLNQGLKDAKLGCVDLYVTNTVKVYPPIDGRTAKTKKPSIPQVCEARPYLLAETLFLRPKHVLALGEVACHSLTGSVEPVGKCRGKWLPLHKDFGVDAEVISTYHPIWVKVYRPNLRPTWIEDLEEFAAKLATRSNDQ